MIKLFFLIRSLMGIHITHHTYNIALTKQFENIFYLRNSPVQPLPSWRGYHIVEHASGQYKLWWSNV